MDFIPKKGVWGVRDPQNTPNSYDLVMIKSIRENVAGGYRAIFEIPTSCNRASGLFLDVVRRD